MAAHDARTPPDGVGSGAEDPETAARPKTGPALGGPEPIHAPRHDAFVDADPPPVGRIERLGLRGPHGAVMVPVFHP